MYPGHKCMYIPNMLFVVNIDISQIKDMKNKHLKANNNNCGTGKTKHVL